MQVKYSFSSADWEAAESFDGENQVINWLGFLESFWMWQV